MKAITNDLELFESFNDIELLTKLFFGDFRLRPFVIEHRSNLSIHTIFVNVNISQCYFTWVSHSGIFTLILDVPT